MAGGFNKYCKMMSTERNKNGEIKLLTNVCVPRTEMCKENEVNIAAMDAVPLHLNNVLQNLNTATGVNDVTTH